MYNTFIMPNMSNKIPKKKYPVIGFQAPPETVKKIDRLAKGLGISRSDILRLIVEGHFQNGKVPTKLIE